jgi:hypothetical protein
MQETPTTATSIRQRRTRKTQVNDNDNVNDVSDDVAKSEFGFATTQSKMTISKTFVSASESQPKLRRAGSSLVSMADGSIDGAEEVESDSLDEDIGVKEDSIFRSTMNTSVLQLRGLTSDFQKSGLPWEGYQCRSLMAGGSGVLYALPCFIPAISFVDGSLWILQAILSVLADYLHIHHCSVWHGIDRYFATCNVVGTFYLAAGTLNPCAYVLISPMPIGCYVFANRAKKQLDLPGWHRWHFAWHVTSSLVVLLVNYLSRHCPEVDSTLIPLCSTS